MFRSKQPLAQPGYVSMQLFPCAASGPSVCTDFEFTPSGNANVGTMSPDMSTYGADTRLHHIRQITRDDRAYEGMNLANRISNPQTDALVARAAAPALTSTSAPASPVTRQPQRVDSTPAGGTASSARRGRQKTASASAALRHLNGAGNKVARSKSLNDLGQQQAPDHLPIRQGMASAKKIPDFADFSAEQTQKIITYLANDAGLNDAAFKNAVENLLATRKHIGIDLPSIKSRNRQKMVLRIRANRPEPADAAPTGPHSLDGLVRSTILQHLIQRGNRGNTLAVARALSRLQCVNSGFRDEVQHFLDNPRYAHVAIRRIKEATTRLANSTEYNNNVLQTRINELFGKAKHIGIDLPSITSPARKSIVLATLAQKTGLLSLELNASRLQIPVADLMQALTAVNAGNEAISTFSLDIARTPDLGADAASLAALGNLTHLTRLNIDANNVGDAGAVSLSALPNLTSLDIRENQISDAGAAALANIPNLTRLNLRSNQISDAGARALAALPNLTYLALGMNNLSAGCAQELHALNHVT